MLKEVFFDLKRCLEFFFEKKIEKAWSSKKRSYLCDRFDREAPRLKQNDALSER
jgi:hypothetical protein